MYNIGWKKFFFVNLFLLLASTLFFYLNYSNQKDKNLIIVENLSISVSSLIVNVVVGDDSKIVEERNDFGGLGKSIRLQTMLLFNEDFSVSDLNSAAFEGLCEIIFYVDDVFPKKIEKKIPEEFINSYLHNKINNIKNSVSKESALRSLRPGDSHKCHGVN